jgi:hypothetical protein
MPRVGHFIIYTINVYLVLGNLEVSKLDPDTPIDESQGTLICNCVGHWKSYYKRFHFNPLKCMAGFNVQCKKGLVCGNMKLR